MTGRIPEPWDISSTEHTPGGPDIVRFYDGHRMPMKPKIDLGSYQPDQPSRRPGESAATFTARYLGEVRDV